MRTPILHNHIAHIVGVGASEQMLRIYTAWLIAVMADHILGWYRADKQLVCDAVSSPTSTFNQKHAISLPVLAASPQPASGGRFRDVTHKAFQQRGARHLVHSLNGTETRAIDVASDVASVVSLKNCAAALAGKCYCLASHIRNLSFLHWLELREYSQYSCGSPYFSTPFFRRGVLNPNI